ncbi:HET-domain-containing protein [Corynespora cassiicola Philippines]|uniref:HET-domain-containing protein n=1 Tax=Corynespora cassiicola Philippines TaxID=1448308 RepID=A0A2T2NVS7_CORCC|nr:HET-domain-containing protein [Corynespora cassiicola Philippines]
MPDFDIHKSDTTERLKLRTGMLCDACTTVLQHVLQREHFLLRGYHHPNADSFKNAAAGGCRICLPWSKALQRSEYPESTSSYLYSYNIEHYLTMGTIFLYANSTTMPARRRSYVISPNLEVNASLDLRERPRSSAISDGLRIAQMWMKKCLDCHGDCPKNKIPTSYPTRLLEIGHSKIHLVQPEGNFSEAFAALSYCWGPNPEFLRLTASNMQQIRDGVAYTDLPIAFQDAVELTRGLGIRYLWIDCLCIIQSGPGSEEDWRTESVKMQDVYSNCIVNISLARAADPSHKCFDTTDAALPFKIPHFGQQSRVVVPTSYFTDNLYNQPLGYRAWVLQERILSPRTLSFGLGELFWECSQLPDASEFFPDGTVGDEDSLKSRRPLKIRKQDFFNPKPCDTLEDSWCEVVEEYTKRTLTKPDKDKLVALSAIAARMMKAMDDVYIMGLFLKMLPRALLWKFRTIDERRRLLNGIPSWSWASVDSPVEHGHMSKIGEPLADIVSYRVCALKDGIPENTGLTIKAFCNRITNKKSEIKVIWRSKGPHEHFGFQRYGIWKFEEIKVDWDFPEKESTYGKREYFLALLTRYLEFSAGLVLERSGAQKDRTYRRVGIFRGTYSEAWLKNKIGAGDFRFNSEFDHKFTSTLVTPFEHEKETIIVV